MAEYPKDNSGRALVQAAVGTFTETLLAAPLEQREDALSWLATIPNTDPAAPFRDIIESALRPGVAQHRVGRERADAEAEDKKRALAARLAAKYPGPGV